MKARDILLASLASTIWGIAFPVAAIGLRTFSPAQLTAVRFLIPCLLIGIVPRPKIPWLSIVLIGLTLFTGQFLLLFVALTQGLPPALAAVTQQVQVFFTVLLAAAFLRDLPSARQYIGMFAAFAGLLIVAVTTGSDLKLTGFALGLAAALSWAVGNVLVKRASGTPVFPLIIWASLVPPLPALAISALYDRRSLVEATLNASWTGVAAAIYLAAVATVIAYAIWGDLLQRYSASSVAPFALLAPCVGIVSSAIILGQVFHPVRYAGMALIVGGLAIGAWPSKWLNRIDATHRSS